MAYDVVLNGTTIPQWSDTPIKFNGVDCTKLYFNEVLTYNYLSMNYTDNIPDIFPAFGSFVGWTGAYATITRYSSTQYKLYLYAYQMVSNYTLSSSAGVTGFNTTVYADYGSAATATIRWAYGSDQVSLRVITEFNADGKLYIRAYGRGKDYQSFTLTNTQSFEG